MEVERVVTTDGGRSTNGKRSTGSNPAAGSIERLARGATGVAAIAGTVGALFMLGAFGPVSCVSSQTSGSSAAGTTTTTNRTCTAGVDYLFGAGGNAPVLFFWAMVLLGLVAVATWSVWVDLRALTWLTAIVSGVVTVLGVFSIGWFFLVPAIGFFTAALAQTVATRQRDRTS